MACAGLSRYARLRRLVAVELYREAVVSKAVIAVDVEGQPQPFSEQVPSLWSVFQDFRFYPQFALLVACFQRKDIRWPAQRFTRLWWSQSRRTCATGTGAKPGPVAVQNAMASHGFYYQGKP